MATPYTLTKGALLNSMKLLTDAGMSLPDGDLEEKAAVREAVDFVVLALTKVRAREAKREETEERRTHGTGERS